MEEPVHFQIPAVVLVDGLGALVVKVCEMYACVGEDVGFTTSGAAQSLCFLVMLLFPALKGMYVRMKGKLHNTVQRIPQ